MFWKSTHRLISWFCQISKLRDTDFQRSNIPKKPEGGEEQSYKTKAFCFQQTPNWLLSDIKYREKNILKKYSI